MQKKTYIEINTVNCKTRKVNSIKHGNSVKEIEKFAKQYDN
jgi:hypothetical protein